MKRFMGHHFRLPNWCGLQRSVSWGNLVTCNLAHLEMNEDHGTLKFKNLDERKSHREYTSTLLLHSIKINNVTHLGKCLRKNRATASNKFVTFTLCRTEGSEWTVTTLSSQCRWKKTANQLILKYLKTHARYSLVLQSITEDWEPGDEQHINLYHSRWWGWCKQMF